MSWLIYWMGKANTKHELSGDGCKDKPGGRCCRGLSSNQAAPHLNRHGTWQNVAQLRVDVVLVLGLCLAGSCVFSCAV